MATFWQATPRIRSVAVTSDAIEQIKSMIFRGDLKPGDRLRTDPIGAPDLAGAHPVGLTVVGVLAASGSADDAVAFADLSTIRAIEGHLHAHDAADQHPGGGIEPSAAVYLAPDLDRLPAAALHLHGDPDRLPVSAVIVAPSDARARDQLLGDLALDPERQAVIPSEVVDEVLAVLLRARRAAALWLALSGAVMVAFVVVVLSLSLRLRAPELALLARLGAGRRAVVTLVAVEVGALLAAAVVVAGCGIAVGLALVDGAMR
jgi:putative ABC transport system permease protein